MNESYSGYINIDDICYTFTINDNQLILIPCNPAECKIEMFKEHKYDVLYGWLTNMNQVCLIGVVIKTTSLIGHTILGSAAAIVIGTRNLGEDISIEPFKSISFMGDVINRFYNNLNVIDLKKSSILNADGNQAIVVKPFSEVFKRHYVKLGRKEYELMLSAGYYSAFNIESNIIGTVESRLELVSNENLKCAEIKEFYIKILNIMRFLNFRKNIIFDKILLKNDSREVIAKMIVFRSLDSTSIRSYQTISYEDICENLEELFYNISSSEIYMLFAPENDKESKYVNHLTYLNACACFEYFYNKAKVENNKDEKIEEIKLEVIKPFEKEKSESIKKFVEYIKNYDGMTLRKKFKQVLKQKKSLVETTFKNINLNARIIDNISYEFSEQRNSIAHGEIDGLTNISVKPYIIVFCLLYILILEESHVPENNIKKILKKIFINYTIDS